MCGHVHCQESQPRQSITQSLCLRVTAAVIVRFVAAIVVCGAKLSDFSLAHSGKAFKVCDNRSMANNKWKWENFAIIRNILYWLDVMRVHITR